MIRCEMAEVTAARVGGNHGPSGWSLNIYSDAIGDEAPYRAILTGLVTAGQATVSLPEWEAGEDCVEGSLIWRDEPVKFYFECQALSYLTFWSSDRGPLEALRAEITKRLP